VELLEAGGAVLASVTILVMVGRPCSPCRVSMDVLPLHEGMGTRKRTGQDVSGDLGTTNLQGKLLVQLFLFEAAAINESLAISLVLDQDRDGDLEHGGEELARRAAAGGLLRHCSEGAKEVTPQRFRVQARTADRNHCSNLARWCVASPVIKTLSLGTPADSATAALNALCTQHSCLVSSVARR